jgi:TolB protein
MKRYLFILIGIVCLVHSSFAQGTIVYCYNDPDLSPNFFVYTMKQDGTENKLLLAATLGLNHYEWSPDGKKIACVGYLNMETFWSIYVFDADGSNLKRLTTTTNVMDGALSWSPDGTKIMFTRSYPAQPNRASELWIMNSDGSEQKFTGISGFQPMWSPDGTRLVYCSSKSGNWEIYSSDIDGKNEKRLTTNTYMDLNPVWSPDGTQIAFMSERTGNAEIFIMNADGTRPVRLTMNTVYDGMPRWSPDGALLVFNSELPGSEHTEVYIINTDGSDLTRLTNSPGNKRSINPAWCPIKPSGINPGSGFQLRNNYMNQNHPNPFDMSTTIDFTLTSYGHVHLEIFDLSGKQINKLLDEEKAAGNYSVVWDSRNRYGEVVPDGLYLYCLVGDNFMIKKKALLMHF